jgi:hypothetical protein
VLCSGENDIVQQKNMTAKLCIFTAVVNNLASDLYFSEAKNDSFSVHFINNQVVDLPTFL